MAGETESDVSVRAEKGGRTDGVRKEGEQSSGVEPQPPGQQAGPFERRILRVCVAGREGKGWGKEEGR